MPLFAALRFTFSGSLIAGLCLISFVVSASPIFSQSQDPGSAGSNTLRVELDTPSRVRLGTAVRAHVVEPLYDSNQLVIPAGTVLFGNVSEVHRASKSKRVSAISHGDFTPLHDAAI